MKKTECTPCSRLKRPALSAACRSAALYPPRPVTGPNSRSAFSRFLTSSAAATLLRSVTPHFFDSSAVATVLTCIIGAYKTKGMRTENPTAELNWKATVLRSGTGCRSCGLSTSMKPTLVSRTIPTTTGSNIANSARVLYLKHRFVMAMTARQWSSPTVRLAAPNVVGEAPSDTVDCNTTVRLRLPPRPSSSSTSCHASRTRCHGLSCAAIDGSGLLHMMQKVAAPTSRESSTTEVTTSVARPAGICQQGTVRCKS